MKATSAATNKRVYAMIFAKIYPLYIAKAKKKGRTKAEVDEIIRWLTGYTQKQFEAQLKKQTNIETFFAAAPKLNPSRVLITGVICGVRVEDIEEPLMREIRYLDKLIDELAKGKAMERILRGRAGNPSTASSTSRLEVFCRPMLNVLAVALLIEITVTAVFWRSYRGLLPVPVVNFIRLASA